MMKNFDLYVHLYHPCELKRTTEVQFCPLVNFPLIVHSIESMRPYHFPEKWILKVEVSDVACLRNKFSLEIIQLTHPNDVHFFLIKQGEKARVIHTLLFVAGVNTLLQSLFGTRLPTIVGGSYSYIIHIMYKINDSNLQCFDLSHEVSKQVRLFHLLKCLL